MKKKTTLSRKIYLLLIAIMGALVLSVGSCKKNDAIEPDDDSTNVNVDVSDAISEKPSKIYISENGKDWQAATMPTLANDELVTRIIAAN